MTHFKIISIDALSWKYTKKVYYNECVSIYNLYDGNGIYIKLSTRFREFIVLK